MLKLDHLFVLKNLTYYPQKGTFTGTIMETDIRNEF